jgi:hypothetical protein
MGTIILLLVTLTCTVIADWPWRSPMARAAGSVLRVLITLALAFMLYWDAGIGIGRAWRRALRATDPVISAPPAFEAFTPYQSGVTTMRREASEDITTIIPLLLALIVVGVSPVLRPWLPPSSESGSSRATAL